jgi:hypothetical protein
LTVFLRRWAVFGILALAAFLFFLELGRKSFWDDEAVSATLCRLPVARLMENPDPYVSPWYYVLLHFWAKLGTGDAFLRASSALAALTCIAAVFVFIRNVAGEIAGLTTALLLAISPFFLVAAKELRCYPLLMCLATVSSMLCFMAVAERAGDNGKSRAWRLWLGWAVVSAAAFMVHYGFLFVLAAQEIYVIAVMLRRRSSPWPWLAANAAFFASWLPWLGIIRENMANLRMVAGSFHVLPLPFGAAGKLGYTLYNFCLGITVLPWTWWVTAPAAVVFVAAFVRGLVVAKKKYPAMLLFAVLQLATVLAIVSFTAKGTPRYALPALPMFLFIVALGLTGMRSRALQTAALGAVVAVSAFSGYNYFAERQFHMMAYVEPVRDIAGSIRSRVGPRDVLVTAPHYVPLKYYFDPDCEPYVALCREDDVVWRGGMDIGVGELAENCNRCGGRAWLVRRSVGAGEEAFEESRNRDRLFEILSSRMTLVEEFKFGRDPDAEMKARFIRKPFMEWRILVAVFKPREKVE